MSDIFSESEIETLHKGAMGAGLLVSVSDRGFFDSFKEAGVLAKHVAVARGSSESAVVKQIAGGRGTGFGVTSSPLRLLRPVATRPKQARSPRSKLHLQAVEAPAI